MSDEETDWHLREWLKHFGKKQRSLVTELGWETKRAHQVWHSQQSFRRKDVSEVAAWLDIKPYELFLSPKEAFYLRRLRVIADQMTSAGDDDAS